MKKIVTTIVTALFFLSVIAANDSKSKKIGLVLSGGGVKGFGHIGTLQLIDSLNIKVDFIVGSSIGAITAALYATGHSVEEIKKIASTTNWDEVFSSNRKRNHLYHFQKEDADKYQLSFSINDLKPIPPISLSSGQYSYEHLSDIFINYSNTPNYDDLIIPFRCNATDIITGEEFIFDKGSISKALRISTSIPTVFTPIENNGDLLVDGGLVNNLPTNLAEDLGAEFIIASSVLSEHRSKDDIKDIFGVVSRIINLYGEKNEVNNIKNNDILISPDFQNISIMSVDPKTLNKIQKEGEKTAYKHLDQFISLSQSNPLNNNFITISSIAEDEIKIDSVILSNDLLMDSIVKKHFYNTMDITKDSLISIIQQIRQSNKFYNLSYKFKENSLNDYDFYLSGYKNIPIIIDSVIITGNNKLNEDEIIELFTINTNSELNISRFNEEIKNAYHTDYFHYINYDIINKNNKQYLNINVKENPNKQIKLGVLWDNHYKLIGKLKLNILNKPKNRFRIQNELFFSGIKSNKLSIYYNLNNKININIIPFISFKNAITHIGLRNTINELSFLKHDSYVTSLGAIIPFNNYGSIYISQNIMDNTYSLEEFNLTSNNYKFYNAILDIDQLDNLLLPKTGYKITADYQFNNTNNNFNYINMKLEYYKTFNHNHTLRLANWYKESSNDTPLYLQSNYGGYNWAAGYDEFVLSGTHLNLIIAEYQYHYKNSTTFRFITNKLIKINNFKNAPINWGLGIKVKSIVGPFNFVWGRGHTDPFDKESKKHNIFYFNFGVEI